jgi:hypothetical protein
MKEKKTCNTCCTHQSFELIVEVTAQLVKLAKIPLRYPCMICFKAKQRALDCPRKTKV